MTEEPAPGNLEPDAGTETSASGSTAAPTAPAPPEETSASSDTGSREAAKYRKRLREAEGERDQLSTQLEAMRRREAERLAGDVGLADAADLWRDDLQLDAVLSEDGTVDPQKVAAAGEELLSRHPHWKKAAPTGGWDGGVRQQAAAPADDFASKLRKLAG